MSRTYLDFFMDLNRIEWSKAQDLLIQLVQILSPLAERGSTAVSFLNKRFFIPPNQEDAQIFRFRHPVSVLKTTLHSAQEQVSEWIEQLPALEEAKPDKREVEETEQARKKAPVPLPQKEASVQSPPPRKGEEKAADPNASKKTPSSEPRQNQPLSLQAQKLINQVRDAIGTLCTSSNIVDPKAAPLREALIRIKPLIDEIIKAVSHEGMHPSDDEPDPQFRFPVPRIPRETVIARQLPAPTNEARPREEGVKLIRRHQISKELAEEKGRESTTPVSGAAPSKDRPIPPNPNPTAPLVSLAPKDKASKQMDKEAEARPVDRIALPGAPFHPEIRSLTPSRKKKKRKGFWFRDDEEKESKS